MSGSSAQKAQTGANVGLQNLTSQQQAQQAVGQNPQYQSILDQFRSGSIDLDAATKQIGQLQSTPSSGALHEVSGPFGVSGMVDSNGQYHSPDNPSQTSPITSQQMLSQFLTDPTISRQVAQSQALSSPSMAGMFGKGGQLEQAQGQYGTASGNLAQDRQALMGRDQSYGLTDQDLAAYGQAAGNTTRMFGNQQSSLASALANRGLGAADSGTANQQFSNSFGNQMEQLAGLQSQIAQNRIQTAQGLAQSRTNADLSQQAQAQQYGLGLSGLGQNAINAAQQGNLQAQGQQYNQSSGTAGLGMENLGTQQAINDTQWQQQQASGFNPLSALGGAVSAGIGGLTGGIGAGIGSSISPIKYQNIAGSGTAGGTKAL